MPSRYRIADMGWKTLLRASRMAFTVVRKKRMLSNIKLGTHTVHKMGEIYRGTDRRTSALVYKLVDFHQEAEEDR